MDTRCLCVSFLTNQFLIHFPPTLLKFDTFCVVVSSTLLEKEENSQTVISTLVKLKDCSLMVRECTHGQMELSTKETGTKAKSLAKGSLYGPPEPNTKETSPVDTFTASAP